MLRDFKWEDGNHLPCFVLGRPFPKQFIVAGHIFQQKWAKLTPNVTPNPDRLIHDLFGEDLSLDSPRNCLLLFGPLEIAFDAGVFCIEASEEPPGKRFFKFRLLEMSKAGKTLGEYWKEKCNRHSIDDFGDVEDSTSVLKTTFGELNDRDLHVPSEIPSDLWPSTRLLWFHARQAYHRAIRAREISPDAFSGSALQFCSPGIKSGFKRVYIRFSGRVL